MYDILRPLLFKLDAESAHRATLYALGVAQRSGFSRWIAKPPADLPTRVFGITFPNPVGLAAGLDKNAEHLDALDALGFGFIEVGTVTPRPQQGNRQAAPVPAAAARGDHQPHGLQQRRRRRAGAQRASSPATTACSASTSARTRTRRTRRRSTTTCSASTRVYALASYITVNISSPNTQGLRDLQEEATLRRFISMLREAQERLGSQHGRRKPMLLKIAPDLSETRTGRASPRCCCAPASTA